MKLRLKDTVMNGKVFDRHMVYPHVPYNVIHASESGSFYYISNPLYSGETDKKNAAWLCVWHKECEIIA